MRRTVLWPGAFCGQLGTNAKSYQNTSEFNFTSVGDQNESLVHAESQTSESKNQETARCRSQKGQTAGEAGAGGAGREVGIACDGEKEYGYRTP
jgi:hypothetical protein